jgi:hypothetical protein
MGGARASAAMSPKRTHEISDFLGEEPKAKRRVCRGEETLQEHNHFGHSYDLFWCKYASVF